MTESSSTNARRLESASGTEDASPGLFERILSRIGLVGSPDLRETIETALTTESESEDFEPKERAMLLNLLRFGALRVEDVMVPRADVIAADESMSVNELLHVFEQAGHSRIPVYHETLDDPRGMIHIKDLMAWITGESTGEAPGKANAEGTASATGSDPSDPIDLQSVDLTTTIAETKVCRELIFVPPSMSVLDLLLRMQTTRIHLALVVDEYGGTDGLVSIEDLVEEIVGEIEDEHDQNGAPLIREDTGDGLIADARAPIEELESLLGEQLLSAERDEDVDTLGGLVFTLLGRVPVRGELVPHNSGIEFEVLDADPRRIKTLRIHTGRGRAAGPGAAVPADAAHEPTHD